MRISFTMNITKVTGSIGEDIEPEKGHYDLALELFQKDMLDGEHELMDDERRLIYFKFEDIKEAQVRSTHICSLCRAANDE